MTFLPSMEAIHDSYIVGLQNLEEWSWGKCSLTGALCFTSAVIVVSTLFWKYSSNATKSKKKPRKSRNNHGKQETAIREIPLSRESRIDNVSISFEQQYKPGLLQLLEKFDPGSEKDVYNKRYYNEMLLKLLLELDGIDITDLPQSEKALLKGKRKTVIKNIQHHLQLLDSLPRN